MSTSVSVVVVAHEVWLEAFPQSSPADPSCNVSEVNRLLWTVTVPCAGSVSLLTRQPKS